MVVSDWYASLQTRVVTNWKDFATTSSPGPSPRSKWRSEKPLAKAAEIHMMKWLFRTLVLASGGPDCFFAVWNRCSNETKKFQMSTWQNSNEFLEPFWQPWSGVSPTAIFERGEDPGDEVDFARVWVLARTLTSVSRFSWWDCTLTALRQRWVYWPPPALVHPYCWSGHIHVSQSLS